MYFRQVCTLCLIIEVLFLYWFLIMVLILLDGTTEMMRTYEIGPYKTKIATAS